MSRILLFNSAVMPTMGQYRIEDSSFDELRSILNDAKEQGCEIISHIAYPDVCDVIYKKTGHKIPLDKEKTLANLMLGDIILIVKLRVRLNENLKGIMRTKNPDEYVVQLASYYP